MFILNFYTLHMKADDTHRKEPYNPAHVAPGTRPITFTVDGELVLYVQTLEDAGRALIQELRQAPALDENTARAARRMLQVLETPRPRSYIGDAFEPVFRSPEVQEAGKRFGWRGLAEAIWRAAKKGDKRDA